MHVSWYFLENLQVVKDTQAANGKSNAHMNNFMHSKTSQYENAFEVSQYFMRFGTWPNISLQLYPPIFASVFLCMNLFCRAQKHWKNTSLISWSPPYAMSIKHPLTAGGLLTMGTGSAIPVVSTLRGSNIWSPTFEVLRIGEFLSNSWWVGRRDL